MIAASLAVYEAFANNVRVTWLIGADKVLKPATKSTGGRIESTSLNVKVAGLVIVLISLTIGVGSC